MRETDLYKVSSWALLVQDRPDAVRRRPKVCREESAAVGGGCGGCPMSVPKSSPMVSGLRSMRNRRGLTIVALGKLVGCSGAHISQIERGVRRPSLVILMSIQRVLECSLADLMGPRDE